MSIFKNILPICFITLSSINLHASAIGENKDIHIVLVSPRGETQIETSFKNEFKLLHKGNVTFSFVQPNIANKEEMSNLPNRLRKMKPDLIYTWGTPSTLTVAGTENNPVITNIPIFFTTVAYPMRSWIVNSESRFRKNVTGTSHIVPMELQFEMMMKFKNFSSIGVVYNSAESQTKFMLDDLTELSKKFNVNLFTEKVELNANGDPDPGSIQTKVQALHKKGVEWLYVGPDTFVAHTHRDLTTKAAVDVGIFSFTPNQSSIKSSFAVFGIFPSLEDMGKYNAFKAIQFFVKGIKPFGRVDTVQKYNIVINQCVLEKLQYKAPKEIEYLSDVLKLENGTCKNP